MNKFGRNFKLVIQIDDSGATITLGPPFTVEFDITRNTLSSANVCQLRIFNLAEKTRSKIRYNKFEYGDFKSVSFKAGYGTNLSECFTGNISEAWSIREGVNFITQIECFDGGFSFINGKTNTSFPAGTAVRDVIIALASSLPNVEIGKVGNYPGTLPRGIPVGGNTAYLLAELTGGGFFVDNGRAYALGTTELINEKEFIISPKSGLIGTPMLEHTIAHFDMLFEPALNIGHKVKMQSLTNLNLNGTYKVTGVKHRGVISDAVCGNAITTGQFLALSDITGKSLQI